MESLVRFTLRQQVLFNLVFLVMILVGVFVVGLLPVERFPEVAFGKATVTTYYPGASPRDVEALVTQPLEEVVDGLEDVEWVRSVSSRERSLITVKFNDDTDYDRLYDELRFRVLSTLGELPELVEPPRFEQIDTSSWLPVVSVNLVGERSNRALTLLAEELKVALARIPGVDEAAIAGELVREFEVALDPALLTRWGVTFDAVASALMDANLVLPAGDYTGADGEYVIRVDERFRDRAQVLDTIVRRDADGSFLRVADLMGSAGLGYRDPHRIFSVNGQDAVAIQVFKRPEGNALDIVAAIGEVLADYGPLLAQEDVEAVLTLDSSSYIRASISTLGWNMAVGIALVGLLLWYFMGARNAALVSVGIPFSFLVTLIIVWLTGNSLNEITLFSFVLVSGIIVDDAIVVCENIYRHVQDGEPLEQAIVRGTAEVMWPVIAATATTVAAFLPMLLMTGSTGEFFALVPKAVSFAIVASLFECIFILPLHYRDFGPRPGGKLAQPERDDLLLRLLRRLTHRVLSLTLRRRWASLGAVVLAFVAAVAMLVVSILGIAPLIRIQFFPDDYNLYYVFVDAPPGTPIEQTDTVVRAIARRVMADGPGHARSAAGFAGMTVTEDYEERDGHHLGTVLVALPEQADRAFADPVAHLERMRERLTAEFQRDGVMIRLRAEKDGPPSGKDVNIQVVGPDETAVVGLADALTAAMAADPGLSQDLIQLDGGAAPPLKVLHLEVDAERAAEYGLTQGQATRLAAAVLDGRIIGDFRLADEEVDLRLKLDPTQLDDAAAALDLPLLEHPSGPVRLGDLVRPVVTEQPGELARYRGQRSRTVSANIRPGASTSPAAVQRWAQARWRAWRERYPGATLVFGGEFEETQRSYASLTRAFGLSVLLIYLILAAQFKSYAQPALILSAVMFSIIGVVFGKFASQSLFTVNSFIALVGVTGVVVNDALVLLDFINRGWREGLSRAEAIRRGIDVRLRPITLTTLTTTLGLLPMALGIPSYSLIWGTMASTFVAGLATATLLTLFIVPVGWDLIAERAERRGLR